MSQNKKLLQTKIPKRQACDDILSAPPPLLHNQQIFDAFVAQPSLNRYFTSFVQPLVVLEVIMSNQICPLPTKS